MDLLMDLPQQPPIPGIPLTDCDVDMITYRPYRKGSVRGQRPAVLGGGLGGHLRAADQRGFRGQEAFCLVVSQKVATTFRCLQAARCIIAAQQTNHRLYRTRHSTVMFSLGARFCEVKRECV